MICILFFTLFWCLQEHIKSKIAVALLRNRLLKFQCRLYMMSLQLFTSLNLVLLLTGSDLVQLRCGCVTQLAVEIYISIMLPLQFFFIFCLQEDIKSKNVVSLSHSHLLIYIYILSCLYNYARCFLFKGGDQVKECCGSVTQLAVKIYIFIVLPLQFFLFFVCLQEEIKSKNVVAASRSRQGQYFKLNASKTPSKIPIR